MIRALGGEYGLKFREWQAFYELDPPDDMRTEYGLAHVIQAILRSDKPLSDFLLPFGDRAIIKPVVQQTLEQQEFLLDAWISGSNAQFRERGIT